MYACLNDSIRRGRGSDKERVGIGRSRTHVHAYILTHASGSRRRARPQRSRRPLANATTPQRAHTRRAERRAQPATSQAFTLVLGTQELCAKPARLSRAPVRLHRNSCAARALVFVFGNRGSRWTLKSVGVVILCAAQERRPPERRDAKREARNEKREGEAPEAAEHSSASSTRRQKRTQPSHELLARRRRRDRRGRPRTVQTRQLRARAQIHQCSSSRGTEIARRAQIGTYGDPYALTAHALRGVDRGPVEA